MSTFDERARGWDTPERRDHAAAVARAIRERVPIEPTARMIEVGAGTGLLGLELAADVGQLVLAEPSQGMLEVVGEKLAARGASNVTAIRFDLTADLPPEEPFDIAISLLVLHHLVDTAAAFEALRRLLRPGGYLALADLESEDGSFHGPEAEGIHHLGFDLAAVARLARGGGFAEVDVRTASHIDRDGRSYPIFLLTARRV